MNNRAAIITAKILQTSGRHNSIQNLLISIALILHTYNVMLVEGYTTENTHTRTLVSQAATHSWANNNVGVQSAAADAR